ncbi:U6 snRNA phosphodiesterase-like isoform X2 [Limulus polyphemus]|uniref:U6 snRNA phosphodiesterase n=1 Tax=Limulus polyphemus TaxID=6850 RepID=A0ABM1T3C9_LIMPO|nr:U6 snRNA phosphodiesterase-like isoform X2 [Limulus polyphemus]
MASPSNGQDCLGAIADNYYSSSDNENDKEDDVRAPEYQKTFKVSDEIDTESQEVNHLSSFGLFSAKCESTLLKTNFTKPSKNKTEIRKNEDATLGLTITSSESINRKPSYVSLKLRKDKLTSETESYFSESAHNDCEIAENRCKTKRPRLQVPEQVLQMFDDSTSIPYKDDTKQRGGRIRSFPHERGVWATYVFVPYTPSQEFLSLSSLLVGFALQQDVKFTVSEDFHLSLSHTQQLRHHWIEPLVDGLKNTLREIPNFTVSFNSVDVYANQEETRTFIGLKVHHGINYLKQLTERVNNCLEEFKLPQFYKDPSFHMSIAWCVGNRTEQVMSILPDLQVSDKH